MTACAVVGGVCHKQRHEVTTVKTCAQCRVEFVGHRDSQRFCSHACFGLATRGPNNTQWKGDGASSETKRGRAANPPIGAARCACGAPGYDRHHVDGNPGNNVPENLAVTCRRCHMQEDGRLALFALMGQAACERKRVPPRECRICHAVKRLMSHGRCHNCDMYWRRTGVERSTHLAPKPIRQCGRCGRDSRVLTLGWCHACYEYNRRTGRDRPVATASGP